MHTKFWKENIIERGFLGDHEVDIKITSNGEIENFAAVEFKIMVFWVIKPCNIIVLII
jgi:hypothetical protein